jgi:hypothetical protein
VRARNIKPSFFKNDLLAELPYEARLLFIGLWCMADREGRLEDRPKRIKMELFPADNVDVDELAQCLHGAGFVQRYVVENTAYIQVVNFKKHQSPHVKEAPSIIPAPDLHGANTMLAPPDVLNPDVLNPDVLNPDVLNPDVLNPEKGLQRETSLVASDKPKRPTQQKAVLSDDEWLASIKANPAYHVIDFDREYGNMQAWGQTNGKQATRKRFLNWLNRVDRPMSAQLDNRYDFLLEMEGAP